MVSIGNTKNDCNLSPVYQGIDLVQRDFSGYPKTPEIGLQSLGLRIV
jgi:hypothetical protein